MVTITLRHLLTPVSPKTYLLNLAFNLIKNFNKGGKKSNLFLTKYKEFLDKTIEYIYIIILNFK